MASVVVSVAGVEHLREVELVVEAGLEVQEWAEVVEAAWRAPETCLTASVGSHAVAELVVGPVDVVVTSTAAVVLHAEPSCVADVDTAAAVGRFAVVEGSCAAFAA